MNRSQIDFAPPSLWRSLARAHLAAWAAAVAGLGLCVAAAAAGYSLSQRSDAARAESSRIQVRLAGREQPARRAAALPEAQANAVNEVVARLNLPWRDLFQAVEAATPGGIALLELTPDAGRHTLKGSAEAKTGDDMLDYITRMGGQPFFSSVVLTRHEINSQDPNKPLRFQFQAEWARSAQ